MSKKSFKTILETIVLTLLMYLLVVSVDCNGVEIFQFTQNVFYAIENPDTTVSIAGTIIRMSKLGLQS